MMPLANAFASSPDDFKDEPTFPLAVTCCSECGLVQLDHVVPAERLYGEYLYVSSTSDAVRKHARMLAERLTRRYEWGPAHLVVEVASNDGTILKAFQRVGTRVLGIEPARNIAAIAEREGVPTVPSFFTEATSQAQHELMGDAAAIIARHVVAHVNDLHDFMRGVTRFLSKDGVLIIEVPYLGELIVRLEFDTIYHEHLSYISLRPIERLCRERGLRLIDVEFVDLHGGSVIFHICREEAPDRPSEFLAKMLCEEDKRGLAREEVLMTFAERVRGWKSRFEVFIEELHHSGADIIGYGAAAKGNTLLNYCPVAARSLRLILDKNPLKHGRYTPGTHIPVQPVEQLEKDRATHMLILAWNFQEEIMRQMSSFARRGGRFITPFPEPRII